LIHLDILKATVEDYAERLLEGGGFNGALSSQVVFERLKNPYVMLTIHSVSQKDFFVYINDTAKQFYGFHKNDLSEMNISFYVKTFHPLTYHLLVKSHHFVLKAEEDFLRLEYRLRNDEGDYKEVKGMTGVLLRDDRGKPLYLLSATCEPKNLSLLVASVKFDMERFTPRLLECLQCLLAGDTNAQIATELGLSVRTVDRHIERIYDLTKVSSRSELIRMCESSY